MLAALGVFDDVGIDTTLLLIDFIKYRPTSANHSEVGDGSAHPKVARKGDIGGQRRPTQNYRDCIHILRCDTERR